MHWFQNLSQIDWQNWQELMALQIGDNTVQDIVYAIVGFVVLYTIFRIFRLQVLHRLKKWAAKTTTGFDDELVAVLERVWPLTYKVVAIYIPLKVLHLHFGYSKILDGIVILVLVIQGIVSLESFLEYIIRKIMIKNSKNQEQDEMAFNAIKLVLNIVVWVTGLLLLLSNLGFNITSLAASLGIGGVAVALAVQNILGDVFSSFSIYFDKPFQIGDFIIIGTDMGHVEKIGLKTTRIRTLQGEELVVSNKELTSTRIQNFKQMQRRRSCDIFGLVYETSSEKLKKAIEIITKVISDLELVELDRIHFSKFNACSLDIEVVYYINSPQYIDCMNAKQELNFAIKEAFEKEGIEFAFPTQTVYVNQ